MYPPDSFRKGSHLALKIMRFHTCIDLKYHSKVVLEGKATLQQSQITWAVLLFLPLCQVLLCDWNFLTTYMTLKNNSGQVCQVLRHSSLEALFLRTTQDKCSIACWSTSCSTRRNSHVTQSGMVVTTGDRQSISCASFQVKGWVNKLLFATNKAELQWLG